MLCSPLSGGLLSATMLEQGLGVKAEIGAQGLEHMCSCDHPPVCQPVPRRRIASSGPRRPRPSIVNMDT